ncbi:hypothetical protein AK812_SmicGene19715 [Symbiodinium microadriaticum]|uniref:Uncharacterized protein n=1 Tax=Symbiodinium microadriaticum TaxID=2951 RepID=A0A1Q9DRU7_SYMMI|nr:hypothetical protein AK812_SmicGene19715 [Symbiodinium microadriaticum]CAE7949364.1 unnamed protein product [Symbiodinium sp. KB8]
MAIDVCCQGKTRLGLTGPTKGGLDKLPEQPESEEDPSDDEDGKRGKSAVELTQGQQELNSFKKFSDSLLSKSAKMHNLLSELEDFIPNIPDGADKKKAHRTATALEKIIEVLEKESESMEVCRAECSMLNNKNISEKDKERLLKKLDDHLQKTTVQLCDHNGNDSEEPAQKAAEGSGELNASTAPVLHIRRGEVVTYMRPGDLLTKLAEQVANGCDSVYIDNSASTRSCRNAANTGGEGALNRKVPCKHVVEIAQAAVTENPHAHTAALREFAAVNESDAEMGALRVFRKYGLSAPVPVRRVNIGPGPLQQFPYLDFSGWVRYLLDNKRLGQLCGTDDIGQMNILLKEFWARYRAVEPDYELWELADAGKLDLRFTLPIYSHSDEGRTLKKKAFWILSCHGALGTGTAKHVANVPEPPERVQDDEMRLNFSGNTWGTQFLVSVMTRNLQNQHPGSMQTVIKSFTKDMRKLVTEGVTSTDGSIRVWCAHLCTKGDLPALIRLGNFERNYARCPKQSFSKKSCIGICHLCLGGVEGPNNVPLYPWEDFGRQAAWRQTMFQEVPWQDEPEILIGIPTIARAQEAFFAVDVWHTFHYGVAKNFLGSALIMLITHFFHDNSWEAKFTHLASEYVAFCKSRKLTPYITEMSRDTFSFDSDKAFPIGHWSKGAVSSNMMLFLADLLQRLVVGNTNDEKFHLIVFCSS